LHTDDNSHLEIVRYAEGSGLKLFYHFSRKNAGARFVNMVQQLLKYPSSYSKFILEQLSKNYRFVYSCNP
jgi:cholesterol oxidase